MSWICWKCQKQLNKQIYIKNTFLEKSTKIWSDRRRENPQFFLVFDSSPKPSFEKKMILEDCLVRGEIKMFQFFETTPVLKKKLQLLEIPTHTKSSAKQKIERRECVSTSTQRHRDTSTLRSSPQNGNPLSRNIGSQCRNVAVLGL